jgi:predicted amidophosphoribosyltransferase
MRGPELRNCRRCGKLFSYVGVPICPDCREKEERQYEVLKEYLREHPMATVPEASRDTGVPAELITGFLRRGLLAQVNPALKGELVCRICGKPIPSGIAICAECHEKLQPSAPIRKAGHAVKHSQRMYYDDIINRRRT